MNSLPKLSRKLVLSIGASFVSLVMIFGAVLLSGGSLPSTPFAEALSTDEVLKAYAEKDTDSDGLPDWQESLYGTDPGNPRSFDESMTDGQAVDGGKIKPRFEGEEPEEVTVAVAIPGTIPAPNSLTDQMARTFFERLARESANGELTAQKKDALVQELLLEFSDDAARILKSTYTKRNLTVSNSTETADYVANVEYAIFSADVPQSGTTLVDTMHLLLEKNDEGARSELNHVSKEFAGIKDRLLALSVPEAYADDHLLLVKVYDTLSRVTKVVAQYEQDPLALLGALKLVMPAAYDYVDALKNIVSRASGDFTPIEGEGGHALYQVVSTF